jgi:predicted glycosyltransferase
MKLWVDMDNAPHVHVLRPIIVELERRGHRVEITARDYGQTLPLLEFYGLKARCIGRHGGKNRARKYVSFIARTLSLVYFALGKRYDVAFSHGSRSIVPAARLLRLPLVSLGDYEHTAFPSFMRSWIRLLLIPDVIPIEAFAARGTPRDRICGYPGLKEDLYIHDFQPDPSFLAELHIDPKSILILIRPPATMAHYAVKQSSVIFDQVLNYLCGLRNVQLILLPRTIQQGDELKELISERGYMNIVIPDKVYNGPSLIWYSDLVISGGGTMNREAAALGVPVFSIYQGPIGAVDRHLIDTGKLVHVKDFDGIRNIPLGKSTRGGRISMRESGSQLTDFIVSRILKVAENAQGTPCA